MFASGVVASWVWNTLRVRPTIQAALGDPPRLKNMSVAPPNTAFPLALHYAESTSYTGPISASQEPSEELVNYVVRFITQGESDVPIRAAAKDAFTALVVQFASGVVTQDAETFSLTLLPTAEWPITTTVENGVIYRQLGFSLEARVFRG